MEESGVARGPKMLNPAGICSGTLPFPGSCAAVFASKGSAIMAIRLTSAAFSQGEAIPSRYTCDGEDISPPLSWSGVPEGARSLALVCDDLDASTAPQVHWVLFNLPTHSSRLPEGVPPWRSLTDGTMQGVNDFDHLGYGGPYPVGATHRYVFKLYALDTILEAKSGMSKTQLLKHMEGHVLDKGELLGTYQR